MERINAVLGRSHLERDAVAAQFLADLLPAPPQKNEAANNDRHESDRSDLWRVIAPLGGVTGGSLLGRAAALPTATEVSQLIIRHPQSSWHLVGGLEARMQLENIVTWGAVGERAYPGAQTLLDTVRRRGLRNSLASGICGTAINLAMDKTVFRSSRYGTFSAMFDTVGVLAISAMPEVHFALKTAMIVGGHAMARSLDNSSWSLDGRT